MHLAGKRKSNESECWTDRLMAYRKDGELMNTSVYGDYAELHLLPGENTVYISRGFDLKVIPNWRCL